MARCRPRSCTRCARWGRRSESSGLCNPGRRNQARRLHRNRRESRIRASSRHFRIARVARRSSPVRTAVTRPRESSKLRCPRSPTARRIRAGTDRRSYCTIRTRCRCSSHPLPSQQRPSHPLPSHPFPSRPSRPLPSRPSRSNTIGSLRRTSGCRNGCCREWVLEGDPAVVARHPFVRRHQLPPR